MKLLARASGTLSAKVITAKLSENSIGNIDHDIELNLNGTSHLSRLSLHVDASNKSKPVTCRIKKL